LMPQYQDFGFQPPARLEAVAQHPNEKKGNCDHQPQSWSDSAADVTPADGVFGRDSPFASRNSVSLRPMPPTAPAAPVTRIGFSCFVVMSLILRPKRLR